MVPSSISSPDSYLPFFDSVFFSLILFPLPIRVSSPSSYFPFPYFVDHAGSKTTQLFSDAYLHLAVPYGLLNIVWYAAVLNLWKRN